MYRFAHKSICFVVVLGLWGCDKKTTSQVDAGMPVDPPISDGGIVSGECAQLEGQVRDQCCGTIEVAADIPQGELPPNVERIDVDPCLRGVFGGTPVRAYDDLDGNGEFDENEEVDVQLPNQVVCIRASTIRAGANAEGELNLPPDERAEGEPQMAEAACQGILTAMEAEGCAQPSCGDGDLVAENTQLLPTCEMIESLQDACIGARSPWPAAGDIVERYKEYQSAQGGPNPWTPWRVPRV